MPPSNTAVLIGYFPKHVVPCTPDLKAPGVREICSVSECMSKGPADWIAAWRHNDLWVYDSEEIAASVAAERPDNGPFETFAYRMLPVRFHQGQEEPIALTKLRVQPLRAEFRFLGFDVVSRSQENAFECSPLSCNYVAVTEPVNQYCLIDEEPTAFRLARAFARQEIPCEPGPYYIVEVWRRQN